MQPNILFSLFLKNKKKRLISNFDDEFLFLLDKEIKRIAMTRDIPSIMSSWLTILHNNPNSYMDEKLILQGLEPNDENRMFEMWENRSS